MSTTRVFFTSYARLDNAEGKLTDAVARLKNRVSAKLGEGAEIFFDTSELKNGVEWQQKLGDALKEIRVAVCLCSPAYLKSAFCAKEFDVFRRRVEKATENRVAILPVVWEPIALPEVIRRFHQPKDPRFPSDYYLAGLYKLITLPSQIENLVLAIDAVADDVVAADAASKLPVFDQDIVYDELPDFFHNPKPGPYGVQLTVLNAKKSQWKPGLVQCTVGALMDGVAYDLRLAWEDVPPDATTLAAQMKKAEESRLVSVFVLDFADTLAAPWQQMLDAIDQAGHSNTVVVVGWTQPELLAPTYIKTILQALFPSGITVEYFPLGNEEAFKEALKRTITTVRIALISADDAAKVIAPEIRYQAVSNGIPVDTLSTLPSPGVGS